MSTRSNIGSCLPDGSISSIYCHYDGFPSSVGRVLLKNYTDIAKVKELLNLGNLSSLGKTVKDCSAYGRDLGDTQQDATVYILDTVISKAKSDYIYIFSDGAWTCNKVIFRGKRRPLFTLLNEENTTSKW